MKILIVHSFYLQRGGEDVVFANEKELLSEGHEVTTLTYSNGGSKISRVVKFLMAPFNLFALRKFNRQIRKDRPDAVHIHNWYFAASPLIIWAARKAGIPVVITLHNFRLICPSGTLFHDGKLFEKSIRQSFPWSAVRAGVYKQSVLMTLWLAFTVWLHRKLGTWNKVSKIIVLSDFVKAMVLRSTLGIDESRIVVKPNFIYDPGTGDTQRRDYFLFVGRLSEEKGIRTLIEAFSDSPFRLRIIGDGPLEQLVKDAVLVSRNIEYLGSLDKQEVLKEMKSAQTLILSSIWYEVCWLPMTAIESLACATPIIWSSFEGYTGPLSDKVHGLSFRMGDPTDLRSALAHWILLPADEKRIMQQASRSFYLEHFSVSANRITFEKIYNDLYEAGKKEDTVLGMPVYSGHLHTMEMKKQTVINTINQYSYMMTLKDAQFKEALEQSDVLLPDGVGIVLASSLLNGRKIKKIAGADLHAYLLERLNTSGGSCFYLGSSENTLARIKEKLSVEYPNITIYVYSPPFKKNFDEQDNERMIAAVNDVAPDVLFVGMTAPKQEKWVHLNKHQLNAGVIGTIGAVFDFYAGTISRPSNVWVNMGLEWLVRLVREPGRMWKRYIYNGPLFLYILLKKRFS